MSSRPGIDSAALSWAEIEHWLDQALDQPQGQRLSWLSAQSLPPALHRELSELLRAEAASQQMGPSLDWGDAMPAAAKPSTLTPGDVVAGWRVDALIGRGGSGEVYRVHRADGLHDQPAALKLLRSSGDADEQARFAAERRLLARLKHPAIVRLIDGGRIRGLLYAVMDYVDGQPLDHHARGLLLDARVDLLARVAEAVAHAHAHLVVHRDLKPANVLVEPSGEVKLLDFGIARVMAPGDTDTLDATQALRLTPDWCAPEQLRGESVGPAADVFALGVMLHQLLTGALPWVLQGSALQRALQRLQGDPPAPPSRHAALKSRPAEARRIAGDLDAIVAQCLQPDAARRYPTAQALAHDLRCWQRGAPVSARGDAPLYLLGRLMRRHRMAVGVAGALLLSVLAGAAGTAWQAREAAHERDIARDEAATAKTTRDVLMNLMAQAHDAGLAADKAAAAGTQDDSPSLRVLLAAQAAQLQSSLHERPQASADALLAVAQAQFQLNDYAAAVPLFESVLQHEAQLPAATVAQARLDLAQSLWRTGQVDRAASVLQQAQAFWLADARRWRNRLLDSRLVQAQLLRAQGRAGEGLKLLEQALPERRALSGDDHVETATLLNNLGVARQQAGQLVDAEAAYQEAWRIWERVAATTSADALNTLNNWAALSLRQGRADEAERLFRQALTLRQQHLPPSAALAALQNNLGKLLLRRGATDEALPLLEQAVALGTRYAGPSSQHVLSALAGLAEGQTAAGRFAEAAATLDRLDAQLPQAAPPLRVLLGGMAALVRARWWAAQSRWADARQHSERAESLWRSAGPVAEPYLAQLEAFRRGWPPNAAR
ncbi:MAG: protein kinase domain-containing protein [Roseateles sp.]